MPLHITSQQLLALGVAGVGLAAWFALLWGALLLTRSRDVPGIAPTQDFGGPEPPAVVSLITSRWEFTEDAVESTLIDLAARGHLEFRQPGDDPARTTIHLRGGDPAALSAYERRILGRVHELAVGGVVPLTALTFRDSTEAASWTKRVRSEIIADARARGLSRRRFSPALVTGLTLAALGVAAAIGVATAVATHSWEPAAVAGVIVFGLLSQRAGRSRGERETLNGRLAAARWLGLKAYLHGDEAFATLPPASVRVWDRYLAYGDAVGAARTCAAVIDLGMGNRRRVWSSFGGTWHRVRVGYPSFWGHYGCPAAPLALRAALSLAAGVLVLWYGPTAGAALHGRAGDPVGGVVLLLGLGLVLRGGYRLVRAAIDVVAPVTVTGQVLWREVWRSTRPRDNRPARPWLHYLVVDDGSGDRTTAWGCPSELVHTAAVGETVTITVRRWTRRVLTYQRTPAALGTAPVDPGPAGATTQIAAASGRAPAGPPFPPGAAGAAAAGPRTAGDRGPGRAAAAGSGGLSGGGPSGGGLSGGGPSGGGPSGGGSSGGRLSGGGLSGGRSLAERGGPLAALAATRPGVLPAQPHPAPSRPGVSASMLLLADEVSRALDLTALADVDQGHDGPMSMAAYTGDDGRPLLYVGTAAGRIARNVMRLPGKAEPIPGIGDEAYAGEHWVSARRGEHVVLLQLRGDAQRADQRNVCWLLNLAASRLPR